MGIFGSGGSWAEEGIKAGARQQPTVKINNLNQLGSYKDEYLKNVMAQGKWGAQMAEFAPYGMAIDATVGLGMGIWQAVLQTSLVDAQTKYMGHVQTLQTTALNAEISHRTSLLKAQKETSVAGMATAERLAKIQSTKEIKLAEIASDTKKALYTSQARQQLFLRTRFYGQPSAA